MKVEWWPIDRPKPYERNPRKIPEKAVLKVAESLKQFGWQQPIVVDKHEVIVVGHTRLLGAKYLAMDKVPVVIATNLTAAQVRAYRIADNRTNQESDWDLDILLPELKELKLDLDLSLTGFDLPEIERFLKSSEEEDARANEAPPLPEKPVSQLGDLWILGKHRLLCGDSTNAGDVARVLGGEKPGLMVTDPPYGVEYDPKWRLDAGVNKPWQKRAEGKVANDDRADWEPAWAAFPGNVAYIWHAGAYATTVDLSLQKAGLKVRCQIIWAKPSLVMGRGAYHWQHEPCWYAVRDGKTANWTGDRKQSTLWQIANMHATQGNIDDGKTIHGTQKPIECMRRPILNHTKRGEAVYDPFLGSGTTLIACQETERVCYGLEIDPKYVDVIVQRWQTFTGKAAGLAECGRTFDQVAADRVIPIPIETVA